MRQSSASPIVCFHQSTRFLRLLRRAKAFGLVVPWINERREEATPAAFLAGDTLGYSLKSPACAGNSETTKPAAKLNPSR